MNRKVFIATEELGEFLEKLSHNFTIWVPAQSGKGTLASEFKEFVPGLKLELEKQTTMPPKGVLLPQSDTLINYEYLKDLDSPSRLRINIKEAVNEQRHVVFGCRPCDVRGFLIFDKVFLEGPYKDVYYRRRRERVFFFTILCGFQDEACFCSSVGSGPADMAGSDVRLTAVKGGWMAEALTARVEPLLEGLRDASDEQEREAAELVERISSKKVGDLDVTGAQESVRLQFQNMELWNRIASPCISCGVCTYVCPTCYCFTITDEQQGLSGERLRSWDSCMFSQYTQEASGHNPRPTKLERYRNRLGHKFSYYPLKYQSLIACCGCGRCIRSCPVSIDIRRAVELAKETEYACKCA